MADKDMGLIVRLAASSTFLAASTSALRKRRGHWGVLAVPPILLILGAIWGVVLLLRGQPDLALLILFLALPVATAWLLLIQYMRRD